MNVLDWILLAIRWGHALAAVAWVGGGIFVFAQRIAREETMLIKQFGESYRDYRRHTGAVFPKVR